MGATDGTRCPGKGAKSGARCARSPIDCRIRYPAAAARQPSARKARAEAVPARRRATPLRRGWRRRGGGRERGGSPSAAGPESWSDRVPKDKAGCPRESTECEPREDIFCPLPLTRAFPAPRFPRGFRRAPGTGLGSAGGGGAPRSPQGAALGGRMRRGRARHQRDESREKGF
ncbi:translation initiation factor IF-2-like [Onychostruthus taczanowskii]|uniref:translation initiation factor IF-2-like n=1 Tax=Onychostruthus taczanowskii TaxID=356909 RepID=UPI001B805BBD|nr:translation initiation factor IF-2-like [Onychostruthus taczanowskii]